MLTSIARLDDAQKDAAFEIFANHQAAEPPEGIMEIENFEQFQDEWGKAVESRAEALAEVLDEPQMESYQKSSATFTSLVETFMRNAFEAEGSSP